MEKTQRHDGRMPRPVYQGSTLHKIVASDNVSTRPLPLDGWGCEEEGTRGHPLLFPVVFEMNTTNRSGRNRTTMYKSGSHGVFSCLSLFV